MWTLFFVVGTPLEVQKIDDPSKEEIEQLHQRFCNALEELFEKHKSKFVENHQSVKLKIE